MAVSASIRDISVTLAAGILTPITPPGSFKKCMIGNKTGANLTRHTNTDLTESRLIANGFERLAEPATTVFQSDAIAFWLISDAGGLVVLEWS